MKSSTTRKAKVSKKSRSRLIKELDKVYSIYIRKSGADENGMVRCYTCGKIGHWKEMHCGHFFSRRYYSTRFFEKNTKVQCVSCNIFNQGAAPQFAIHLIKEYGNGILEELEREKNKTLKLSIPELEDLIKYYHELSRIST